MLTNFYRDMIERAVRTFFQAALTVGLGMIVAPGDVLSWGDWKRVLATAAAGGFAAGCSALTSLFAKNKGPNTDSASFKV